MSRCFTLRFAWPVTALCALMLAAAEPASAQQTQQPPRGAENGGEAGRGGTGGGSSPGGANGGGRAAGGSEMTTADQIFADGVQRQGAPEERGIGNGPGGAGGAGGAGAGRGLGGFGGMGGFGGLGGFGGMSPFGGSGFGGQGEQRQSVRTRLRSGVEVAPLPAQRVGAVVHRRLTTLYGNPTFHRVNVQMEGRTAVLTGQVSSEEDRRMAMLLVRLEPGVSRIENRIEVAPRP